MPELIISSGKLVSEPAVILRPVRIGKALVLLSVVGKPHIVEAGKSCRVVRQHIDIKREEQGREQMPEYEAEVKTKSLPLYPLVSFLDSLIQSKTLM